MTPTTFARAVRDHRIGDYARKLAAVSEAAAARSA